MSGSNNLLSTFPVSVLSSHSVIDAVTPFKKKVKEKDDEQ